MREVRSVDCQPAPQSPPLYHSCAQFATALHCAALLVLLAPPAAAQAAAPQSGEALAQLEASLVAESLSWNAAAATAAAAAAAAREAAVLPAGLAMMGWPPPSQVLPAAGGVTGATAASPAAADATPATMRVVVEEQLGAWGRAYPAMAAEVENEIMPTAVKVLQKLFRVSESVCRGRGSVSFPLL